MAAAVQPSVWATTMEAARVARAKIRKLEPKEDMSKLSELANSIKAATQAVEDEAYRALSRLHKARDNATVGIAKIDGVSASIEASTADIENFTNQISNGGPPL